MYPSTPSAITTRAQPTPLLASKRDQIESEAGETKFEVELESNDDEFVVDEDKIEAFKLEIQELMTKTKMTNEKKIPHHDEQKERFLSTLKEMEKMNPNTTSASIEVPVPSKEKSAQEEEDDKKLRHEQFVALTETTLKDLEDRRQNPPVEENWEEGQYVSQTLIKSLTDIKEQKAQKKLRLFSGLDEKQPDYEGTVCPQCKCPCDVEEMEDYNGKCSFCRQIDLRDPAVHKLLHFDYSTQWSNSYSQNFDRSQNTVQRVYSNTNSMSIEQDPAKLKIQLNQQRKEQQERLYPKQEQKEDSQRLELQRLQKQEELKQQETLPESKAQRPSKTTSKKSTQTKQYQQQQQEQEKIKENQQKSNILDSFLADGDIDKVDDDTYEDIDLKDYNEKPQQQYQEILNQQQSSLEGKQQQPSKAGAKSNKATGIALIQQQDYEQQQHRQQQQQNQEARFRQEMQEERYRYNDDYLTDGDLDERDDDTWGREILHRITKIEENIEILHSRIDYMPGWAVSSNLKDSFEALEQENKDLVRLLRKLESRNPTDSDLPHCEALPQPNNIIF
jgi:hypothetical protein